jgi:hypothetical protein
MLIERLPVEKSRENLHEGNFVLIIDDKLQWNFYQCKRLFNATLSKAFLGGHCRFTRPNINPHGAKSNEGDEQTMIAMAALVKIIPTEEEAENLYDGMMAAHERLEAETKGPMAKFAAAVRLLV